MKWNKARVGGELMELKGLTRRREAEAIRWSIMAPKHVNIEKLSILHINNLSR